MRVRLQLIFSEMILQSLSKVFPVIAQPGIFFCFLQEKHTFRDIFGMLHQKYDISGSALKMILRNILFFCSMKACAVCVLHKRTEMEICSELFMIL